MATHIALLRGINVGGRNKVSMADLRAVVAGLGHTDVATYIQSGNVLFTSGEADTEALATALEEAIASNLGVKPAVVVLSRDDLARAVRDNPYPDEPNPKMVHAVFFRGPVPERAAEAIEAGQRRAAERGSGKDTAQVAGGTLYRAHPGRFRPQRACPVPAGPVRQPGRRRDRPQLVHGHQAARPLRRLICSRSLRLRVAGQSRTADQRCCECPESALRRWKHFPCLAGQHPYARRRL